MFFTLGVGWDSLRRLGTDYVDVYQIHCNDPSTPLEETLEALHDVVKVSRAQIALAWLRTNPAVVAPLVGASRTTHIDDAVASLDIDLTGDEIALPERHYTPRHDFQGISDDTELQHIMARLPQLTPASA